jgi:hypothetical protein
MLHELTFVDSVLLITVFDLAAVRDKFSCKHTPKFTWRPELGRTIHARTHHTQPCSATQLLWWPKYPGTPLAMY